MREMKADGVDGGGEARPRLDGSWGMMDGGDDEVFGRRDDESRPYGLKKKSESTYGHAHKVCGGTSKDPSQRLGNSCGAPGSKVPRRMVEKYRYVIRAGRDAKQIVDCIVMAQSKQTHDTKE
ncbi:hypothetical protein L249_1049 [Ophiocordyceps polyrhachis-furcata BCC 54312]|uniref:Uncharacterized protein n=1 Tax=Ophiocordyceps polyrhachis-furcata BCC 54312 TaxID=1330021 RepID=A0A367LEA9_9HYPO|nr:hypothetical protein L249_1049 [Ophiocordyceps polyrhachis-furcata BCC 54312]